MLRKTAISAVLAFGAAASWATVDANKGNASELDALAGVGPAMSQRIVDARKQGEFKDWNDFMARVKGVKEKSAGKLSGAGLTVQGKPYGATTAPAAAPGAPKK